MGYIAPDFIKSKIANRVNPLIAVAQADAESNFDNYSIRYEPKVYQDQISKGETPANAKLLSTSYGLFQIMGYNLKAMNIDVTQPGKAGLYLASPTDQINSYVTFTQGVRKQFPADTDFIAAYNGGAGAVQKLKTLGYYGKAEPYVFKVKTNLNTVTPDDRFRYQKYLAENGSDIVAPVLIITGFSAVLYFMTRNKKEAA